MKPLTVPLDSILADPLFNVRASLDGSKEENHTGQTVEDLAKSIIRDGLMTSLVVMPGESGKYKLVAGFRRFAALNLIRSMRTEGKLPKNAKIDPDHVPVQVFEGKQEDAAVINFNENLARKDLTTYEVAYGCFNLMKNFGFSDERVRNRTGLSESHIRNLVRAFDKLHDKIKDAWRSGHGAATTDWLIDVCKLDKDQQLDEWESRLAEKGDGKRKRRSKDEIESDGTKKLSRPLPRTIEDARNAVNASREIPSDVKSFVLSVFDFVLGNRKDIPGVFDPEEMAKLERERKEQEKLAAQKDTALVQAALLNPAIESAVLESRPDLAGRIAAMRQESIRTKTKQNNELKA